jgi:hypothetical protein
MVDSFLSTYSIVRPIVVKTYSGIYVFTYKRDYYHVCNLLTLLAFNLLTLLAFNLFERNCRFWQAIMTRTLVNLSDF